MNYYQSSYFNEEIFSTDYSSMADVIFNTYKPKKIIEFGCGPGHLTRELSKYGVQIEAIDGYSFPDFKEFSNIQFEKIDLNDELLLSGFLKGKKFDMAICTEVAEHLNPASSNHLIKYLTGSSMIVIFSAAVPEQNGHGHINCRPRLFWHDLFVENNFRLVDSLRKKIRENNTLAIWYRLNLLDYVSANYALNDKEVIRNLIDSESYSSSLFYKMNNENAISQAYLKYPFVKQYFEARNFFKKILKK